MISLKLTIYNLNIKIINQYYKSAKWSNIKTEKLYRQPES